MSFLTLSFSLTLKFFQASCMLASTCQCELRPVFQHRTLGQSCFKWVDSDMTFMCGKKKTLNFSCPIYIYWRQPNKRTKKKKQTTEIPVDKKCHQYLYYNFFPLLFMANLCHPAILLHLSVALHLFLVLLHISLKLLCCASVIHQHSSEVLDCGNMLLHQTASNLMWFPFCIFIVKIYIFMLSGWS